MESIPLSSAGRSSGRERIAAQLQEAADLAIAKAEEVQRSNRDRDLMLAVSAADTIVSTVKLMGRTSPKFKETFGGIEGRGVSWLIRAIAAMLTHQVRTGSTEALSTIAGLCDRVSSTIRAAIADEIGGDVFLESEANVDELQDQG